MKTSSSANQFTFRELRRYRALFRSRDLHKSRNAIQYDWSSNIQAINILVFVSMGPLTSKIRAIIRKDFSRIISNSNIKISLLPTALSQNIRHSTYLQEVKSLLKGNAFQRLITFNIPESIKDREAAIGYAKSQISNFFVNIKKIAFSEVKSNLFNPVAIIFPTKEGALIPRRYTKLKGYLSESPNTPTLDQISIINTPVISICKMLEAASKNRIFSISRVSKLFSLLFMFLELRITAHLLMFIGPIA